MRGEQFRKPNQLRGRRTGFRERRGLPVEDLRWAADTIVEAATEPLVDAVSYEGSLYAMGADRAAARSVPMLLLEPFDHVGLDEGAVQAALAALGGSLYDEVRTLFVTGCAPVWGAPCSPGDDGTCRRHQALWQVVQAGVADCRLGPFNLEEQRRTTLRLDLPFVDTLPGVAADDLLLNRITMPLACAAAARGASCVQAEADALLPVLLDAHRRGYDHWMREGYAGYTDQQSDLVARLLLDLTLGGNTDPLVRALVEFISNNHALYQLLHDLTVLFTYDDQLREQLPQVWPLVLSTVLDTLDGGANLFADPQWADYVVGALLPTPETKMHDTDIDATLARARAGWVAPGAFTELVARWLLLAVGEPKAADAVVQFARTTPLPWQATTGLAWLEKVVGTRYDQFTNRCWFVGAWLEELRTADALDADGLARWHRVVDGLAAAADTRAVGLQRIDE